MLLKTAGDRQQHEPTIVKLMKRMHKPDPKAPADAQDKRSVIPIEAGDVDTWLAGTVEEASTLLRLATVELFDAGPPSSTL